MPQAQQGFIISTSAQISPGSVERTDLAADLIDGTKIADDVVDSEHYVAASIDNEHLADNAVGDDEIAAHTTTKIVVPLAKLTTPSEAQGDIMIRNASGWVRLAAGTSGHFLKTLGALNDPLWAAAGINFSTTQVFSGNAPTSDTDLDLSSVVGAAAHLVLLKCSGGTSQGTYSFGVNGDSLGTQAQYNHGAGTFRQSDQADYIGYVIVKTDTSGIVHWKGSSATGTFVISVQAWL